MQANTHGMLLVAANVAPEFEADFNRWYDREHVEERVAIDGFISGARYEAIDGRRKYLGLYETASLAVFSSAAYRCAFERQTPWSVENLGRMVEPMRRVSSVASDAGKGSGAWLLLAELHAGGGGSGAPDAEIRKLQQELISIQGGIRTYLLQPDAGLSTPLPRESAPGRVLRPFFVAEGSSRRFVEQAREQVEKRLGGAGADSSLYALGWKLFASELRRGV